MSNTVTIKLTGENADLAYDGWARKTGLRMDRADYVRESPAPRGRTGAFSVCFVVLDVDTFETRLAKLKEGA